MSIYKHVVAITSAALFTLAAIPAAVAQDFNEKPSAAEIAKLGLEGTELTPAGAIRAGNAEGTIRGKTSPGNRGGDGIHAVMNSWKWRLIPVHFKPGPKIIFNGVGVVR
ncbi:MAG: hypothetical protein IPK48_07250 [Gammaproteobacteria bacterium]|nr:hypothetical protein [Gammaproteobacteria bacterium]